jgi:hypothetical protein
MRTNKHKQTYTKRIDAALTAANISNQLLAKAANKLKII